MGSIQLKFNRYAKKQKNTTQNKGENPSVETYIQMTHDKNLFRM